MQIRLNKHLAGCGLGSRRECDSLIQSGEVYVNGVKANLGAKIDPVSDTVTYKGKEASGALPFQYIAYNKPRNIIVTATDPQQRETVYDALEKSGLLVRHLKYMGRLDYDSEGLLLMTNDGDLIHALTHPKFGIKKTYRVLLNKALDNSHLLQLTSEGIVSDGQSLRAARIAMREKGIREPHQWYEMDLFEGKNRQIRRMAEAAGYEVLQLKRIQFGVVKLRELPTGAWRELEEREVMGLKKLGYQL